MKANGYVRGFRCGEEAQAGQSHEFYIVETIEYVVVSCCCSRKANNEVARNIE